MKDFKELQIWQKSHQLTLDIYKVTRNFPKEELYGLVSQIRRSASSIPTNIAEGCGRGSEADFGRFLQIAMGSASETEYHLILSKDLGLIELPTFHGLYEQVTEVKKMLSSFLKKLRAEC